MSERNLSPKERRALVLEVRRLIGKSYVDEEILDHLNIRPNLLNDIKKEILAVDTAVFSNLSSAGVMSDFVDKSHRSIKELDVVSTKFKNRGQWSALVAAIKVKHEIHKDVIKLGQDLGFIDKKTGELKVTGEMQFSTVSDAEVMKEIQDDITKINKMIDRKTINMRPEISESVGAIQSYLPVPVNETYQEEEETGPVKRTKGKSKVTAKIKVSLRKRV